jgi:hypothetical protein
MKENPAELDSFSVSVVDNECNSGLKRLKTIKFTTTMFGKPK